MNKSKIDWCDYTWNPVTGCLHNCQYCYARRIVERFSSHVEVNRECIDLSEFQVGPYYTLDEPWTWDDSIQPYPFGFLPTLHRYHLGDPARKTKGVNVFVCSMADLFGSWVPEKWKQEVFKSCEVAPQHNYIFLTKNVRGLPVSSYLYSGRFNEHPDNYWFGTTVTCQRDLEERFWPLINVHGNVFLSIEPLHDRISLSHIETDNLIFNHTKGVAYYLGGGQNIRRVNWVIIGAETGSRKDKIIPERSWIEEIVFECKAAGVPVFMKSNLQDVWNDKLIQEYPEGLRK